MESVWMVIGAILVLAAGYVLWQVVRAIGEYQKAKKG